MHCYSGYGLIVASDMPLPELPPLDCPVDAGAHITMSAGQVAWTPLEPKSDWFNCEVHQDGGVHMSWQDIATVYVSSDGSAITYDPAPDLERDLLRQALIGPVLAYTLRNRGLLVLHASAVALPDARGACLFLGRSGAGKSTMAASMCVRGHQLITDDVLALDVDPSGTRPIRVLGGLARCKLWQDSAEAIGCNVGTLRTIHSQVDKFEFAPGGREDSPKCLVPSEGLALTGGLELCVGEQTAIRPMSIGDALLMLIPNCFVGMFDRTFRGRASAAELVQCARVVREAPFATLTRPRDLGALGDTAAMVERWLYSKVGSPEGSE
jgi:hypothetical protein